MTDKILEMFFEGSRWEAALNKGAIKGIKLEVLRNLTSPEGRKEMLAMIMTGNYHIERPHTAKIPKDTPGEFRTVFVNSDRDRLFLSLVNDLLFEIAGDMIHPQCTSYQKGVGCAKIVQKASKQIVKHSNHTGEIVGWKSDLSKYFDSVPIRYIDEAFDKIEGRFGHSKIIDVVREYYHNDLYYDSECKCEVIHYQSLKQGCAVASWLADVILYHIDEKLSGGKVNGYYVRYSDDMLYIGEDYNEAMQILSDDLNEMQMTLNPKKVEYLTNDRWFKFLGFSIKGDNISLSQGRINTFATEIYRRTIKLKRQGVTYETTLRKVYSWLYYGDGEHSWATGVLKTINVQHDINKLNGFIMDCLRAVKSNKSISPSDLGGLGWSRHKKQGCIERGKGTKVRALIDSTGQLEGYHTLQCMKNVLMYGRDVYDTMVRDMIN